jgi:phenylpropionate dioxygenase-like ring-hydroxylating dioxygenase large terminal subunit
MLLNLDAHAGERVNQLIKNMWYVVLDAREVPSGKPVAARRMGEQMVFWRDQKGVVCCIADKCCHRGASLGAGEVVAGHVQCPFHGLQYDASGRVKSIPANGVNIPVPLNFHVKSYPVREEHGLIWLWWGDERESYPEIEFFDNLKTGYVYSGFSDPWPVHYSRAVENQLDPMHLPFVHRTTIGRGNKRLVHGPVTKVFESLLKFYVWNVVDDGKTKALKPSEIPDYEKLFQLNFRFPNIWQNLISNKTIVFAAFVPVDEENSITYIRFYQNIMTAPVLRDIFGYMSNRYNRLILSQDKAVVVTQIPVKTSLKMGENLVQGDGPILEYRKRREQLQGEGS